MSCEQCKYCRFPRSSNDNGGSCKCKIAKYKTIDVYVSGGETPLWCPLLKKEEKEGKERLFKFVGYDSWDRPVYEGEDGALLVDTDPVLNKPMRLCTKLGNQTDRDFKYDYILK